MIRMWKITPIVKVASACMVVLAATEISKAGQQNTVSAWDSTAIQVDGKANDWTKVPATFLPEQNAAIALSNDGQFLYVLFRTNDRRNARVIKMAGLTISLDPSGGKNQVFQIKFKGGPSRDQLGRPEPAGPNMPEELPQDLNTPDSREYQPTFTCAIKDRISEKEIPVDGSEGPAVAFDTSLGFFTYEFRIPLIKDSIRYYGIDSRPGRSVGISLVWGDMSSMGPRREGEGMRVGMGDPGGPGGGMGAPRSGMGGGMMDGAKRNRRPQPMKKQEVWLKATLAAPKSN